MIAKFSGYNSHTNGRSIVDSEGYYGQVFLVRDSEFTPKNRELWLCETLRTGDIADDVHFTAGVVRPIRQLDQALDRHLETITRSHGFLDKRGHVCFLGRQARRAIVADPGLLPVLTEAIAGMDVSRLPMRGIESVTVNVGRYFTSKTCSGTFPITKDTPNLFAFLRGFPFPVRVIEKKLEQTNLLRLGINYAGAGRWHQAPNKTWGIQWVSTGDFDLQAEPTETNNPPQFRSAFDFWKRNARYYREDMMSAPFDSTWTEVLDASRKEQTEDRRDSETPVPRISHPAAPPTAEQEGALLPE